MAQNQYSTQATKSGNNYVECSNTDELFNPSKKLSINGSWKGSINEKERCYKCKQYCCYCICCPSKMRPKCCNLCCFLYIILILLIIGISLFLFINGLLSEVQIPPILNVYGQLFEQGMYITFIPPLVYLNATGQMKVELYNPMNLEGKASRWTFRALTFNFAKNEEQWGYMKCSSDIPEYTNISHYNANNDNINYNKSFKVTSHETTNVSCILKSPAIEEDSFNLALEMMRCVDNSTVELGLSGYGYVYSPFYKIRANISLDCWFRLDASRWMDNILPEWWINHGPQNCSIFNNFTNIIEYNDNNINYLNNKTNYNIVHPFSGIIPNYQWQKFPVVGQQCATGIVSLGFDTNYKD